MARWRDRARDDAAAAGGAARERRGVDGTLQQELRAFTSAQINR
jgi:hypothetical protein